MSTLFNMTRDINGYNGFGVSFSDDGFQTTLAIGVAQTYTVPSNYENWLVIFSNEGGARVWVANNATATIPGASMTSTVSELLPTARAVKAGDVLSFISSDAGQIGGKLYALS